MQNYQAGINLPVAFQPTNGSNTVLNIRGWSGDHEIAIFDVTHTGSGGHTARITGKDDWRGSVNAVFDLDQPAYSTPPSIRPGVKGIIQKYVATNKVIQIPVVITKVHYESAVENELRYNFDVAMDSITGVMVYPAA